MKQEPRRSEKRASLPSRGDVWSVNLDPVRRHEQGRQRPCLIISFDRFNFGLSGLVIALPLTSKNKGIPFHVRISPPDGGLNAESYVMCEMIRSISLDRIVHYWGKVSQSVISAVEDRLRIILSL